jgi:phospholipid transport system substrate-binding protein
MPFIARFTLGRYWQLATIPQRETYTDAFTEYVLQVYSKRLEDYAGETLRVISERRLGENDVMVFTRVERPPREPIETQWRVRSVDGRLRIVDIAIAGVSMVVTQRDEFASILQRQGVDGLISAMRARTEELRRQG